MGRILWIGVAVLLLVVLAYPFAQNAYQRYQVRQHLDSVMNSQEKAEFRDWKGDAPSYAKRLYERCELTHGRGAVQCGRYRYAFD